MKWQLRTLVGEYEDATGEKLSYSRMSEETGLSKTILNKIGRNETARADLNTLRILITYFSQLLDRKLDTNDILKYEE